jgi:hypothetical protein
MDLTSEEVERCLNKIFTGQELVYVNDKLFVFRQPTNDMKAHSDLIYDRAYKKALESGLLSISELEVLIKKRNLFTEEDEDELEELKTQKFAQEAILSKTTKVKARQDRLLDIISKLDDKIYALESKRTSKLSMSAEAKAEEERALYVCWACVFDENLERHWPTFEDLLNEKNLELRNQLLIKFIKFRSGIDTKIIRYVARHNLWRIRYVTSQKVSDPLFGVPTSQYTNDMLNLAYWSNFYQNLYEMMPKDRPSDSVIEDDVALDAYMKSYYEERSREDAAERGRGSSKGKLSAFDKEEVIVTKASDLYQDIDYDKPREAQMIKDKPAVRKKARKKYRG